MFRAIRSFLSGNNPSVVLPSDSSTKLPSSADVLLHVSSFLNQTDFGSTKLALGHLLRHAPQEEKADNCFDASGVSQALPSAAISSKATATKGLYNASAFHKISAAGQLLKATEYADYEQVETLIANNRDLDLMFEPVSFKFRNGSEERISPLRYAFKVLDTYMWKTVFLKRIQKIEDPAKREEYLKKFFEQMKEQEKAGHIDLKPLFQAYKEYERQYQYWHANKLNKMVEQALNRKWYNIGEKQKALLPVHMLKEFSRENHRWDATALFNVDHMPPPSNCRIKNQVIRAYQPLSSILSDPGWGTSFSLGHGESIKHGWANSPGFIGSWCRSDSPTFRHLLHVRSEDFARQLSLMSQNAPESQAQQNQQIGL